MARHKSAGEVLYEVWVGHLPPGNWQRNTYWDDLSEEDKKRWGREAKKVADAYTAAHPPKGNG